MSLCLPIRLLFIMFTIHAYKCYNSYRKEIGPNGEDIWLSTSDFIPVQSQPYATIRLGQVMSAEFDFIWSGRTNYPRAWVYENFFRVGYDATNDINCNGEGARYPSFWLSNDEDTIHVSTSSGNLCQPSQSLQEYGPINISIPYHIQIAFNNTRLVVQITGGNKPNWSKEWKREPTPSHHLGQIVPIWWMSNKHSGTPYNVGSGIFSNIIIKSARFNPTASPTKTPSSNPTIAPSISPVSVVSTAVATHQPSFITDLGTTEIESEEVDIEDKGNMYYIHVYLTNKVNVVLLVIGILTCVIGIYLWSAVIKSRNKTKGKEQDDSVQHEEWIDEGVLPRLDTCSYNGEDEIDDLKNEEEEVDNDDEIIEAVNETTLDMYIHNVIHNDIDGDLRTETVGDIYPECIVLRTTPFYE